MIAKDAMVILIAPNTSEQMGGEAIKALNMFREIRKVHPNVIQVTHERNKIELSERLKLTNVHYIYDTAVSFFLWHSVVFRWVLNVWFSVKAVKLAESLAKERGAKGRSVIIHQTEPNSPVMPRGLSKVHINVLGPINGNIYYPECFRSDEKASTRLRRIFHMWAARMNKWLSGSVAGVDLILCAGGNRTRKSLLACGCAPEILVDTLDCGIEDEIVDRPRVQHSGMNPRFIHYGRLVFHKCTVLIIQSLAKTVNPVCLDIVGRGPELERCKALVAKIGPAGQGAVP
jgi:glycosyltransferase involved in cell wall biosynthesis